jgi:hypothetical protein
VLDREGPDEETLAAAEEAADDAGDDDADEDLGGAADIDGWDVEGEFVWIWWLCFVDCGAAHVFMCRIPVLCCSRGLL